MNSESSLPVLYFQPFSGAVKSFAESHLSCVAGKSIAFADFFPGEALKSAKGNLASQSVAGAHYFIEEQGGFGPHEIAMPNLVFSLRVERCLQRRIFALRFADKPDVSAEQISGEIPHIRATRLLGLDRF